MIFETIVGWILELVAWLFYLMPDFEVSLSSWVVQAEDGAFTMGSGLYRLREWLPLDMMMGILQASVGLVTVAIPAAVIVWLWGRLPFTK